MQIKARVFETQDGNRFLVPGYWYAREGDGALEVIVDSMLISVACNCKPTNEWMDLEANETGQVILPIIPCRLVGRQFEHGAIDVFLIGGPMFDKSIPGTEAILT